MSVTYSNYITLGIDPKMLIGRPGLGVYRLGFSVNLKLHGKKMESNTPPEHPASAVSELTADIHARGNRQPDYFLGVARPESPQIITLKPSAYESQCIFYLELDRAQLEALERLREGGDLWFRPLWYCVVHGARGPETSQLSGLEFHANQSTWLTVLRDMAYRASLLFEIPIPSEANGALREAVRHLNAAEEDYRINRNGDAIVDCRKALEELANGILDTDQLRKAKQLYSQGAKDAGQGSREEMTVNQRFLLVYETLRHVTNLSAHTVPSGAGYEFQRRDAAAVIALTAVVLSRIRGT